MIIITAITIMLHFYFLNLKIMSFISKRCLFGQCSCHSTSKQGYLWQNFKAMLFGFVCFLIFHASCSYDNQKTCKRAILKVVPFGVLTCFMLSVYSVIEGILS